MRLNAHHATRPKEGETVNGDTVVIRASESGAMIAVVDALGHGPIAAEVARSARDYLEAASLDEEVGPIIEGLHHRLRGTRGAAAMLCLFRDGRVQGCGVGNVDLRVMGGTLPVMLSPGVLGGAVRKFRVFSGELRGGSRLILFSDGISARFVADGVRLLAPGDACDRIMRQHGHPHDDATVLIADVEH